VVNCSNEHVNALKCTKMRSKTITKPLQISGHSLSSGRELGNGAAMDELPGVNMLPIGGHSLQGFGGL
jgi:hypothetical protein